MPNPLINIGSAANDGTGELGPRGWLQKVNRLPVSDSTINAGSGDYSGTPEQKITAAIAAAVLAGIKYVWVPQSMLPYTATLVTFNTGVRMIREGSTAAWWDIQAYGAKGDGIQDDTAATNAAVAGAQVAGGTVFVPSTVGGYGISATLDYKGTNFSGAGGGKPFYLVGDAASAPLTGLANVEPSSRFVWIGAASGKMCRFRRFMGGGVRNIQFDGVSLAATGIQLEASAFQTWEQVSVTNTVAGAATDAAFVFHGRTSPDQQ